MKKLKAKIKNKLGEKRVATLKKILNVVRIIKNVICWTMIVILTAALVIFLFTKRNGSSPRVFGYSIYRIESGSMEPELSVGDIILGKEVEDPSEVQVGDIVTFQGGEKYDYQMVTHRVIVAPYEDSNGNLVFITKGDANEADDGASNISRLESKLQTKIQFLKRLYDFFFSKWGFLIFIFLIILIFFDEIMNIIRVAILKEHEEKPETVSEIYSRLVREEKEKEEQARLLQKQQKKPRATGKGAKLIKKNQKKYRKKKPQTKKKKKKNPNQQNRNKKKNGRKAKKPASKKKSGNKR